MLWLFCSSIAHSSFAYSFIHHLFLLSVRSLVFITSAPQFKGLLFFSQSIRARHSIPKDVKRSFSVPNEGKKESAHRKLSRPSFNQKSFSPDRAVLWEESLSHTEEEDEDEERRLSIAVYGSYRKESVPRGRFFKV